MTTKRFTALLLLSVMLSSCAFQTQVIHLDPAPPKMVPLSAGDAVKHEVILITRDGRPSQEIGRRSAGSRNEVPITTDTDVAGLLQTQMTAILKAKGYDVVGAGASTVPTLEVELKELSYVAFDAGQERKVKIEVLVETFIKNGPKTWRNTFQAKQERRILMEPVAKSNEEWINETFADALKEVANDSRLFSNLE